MFVLKDFHVYLDKNSRTFDYQLVRKLRDILPEIIRDNSQSYDVQATAIFPPGIGKDDIKEVLPTLYPGRIHG